MKKVTKILMLFLALSALTVSYSYAQEIVVHARLAARHEVRTARPSPRHVWVGGEWAPSGGTYTWRAGYWTLPQREGAHWIPGHWWHKHHGYVWVAGRWA